MIEDITPNLIMKVNKSFRKYLNSDKTAATLIDKLKKGQTSYKDAYKYALSVGNARAKAFKSEISAAILPDGRMYYNIGERLLNDTLGTDYKLITEYSTEVQTQINRRNRINLKAQKPKLDRGKIEGFVNRLDSELDFDKVAWILDEPVRLHALGIVDDAIKKNADFQNEVGIKATVVRIPAAGCCKWCDDLAGEYTYPGVPGEVFTRHDNCRCIIDYNGSKLTGAGHSFNG